MKWQLGHKNSGAGLSATNSTPVTRAKVETPKQASTPQSGDIKGNVNSKIYHFAHCSGYKTMSDKNAVLFKTESEAIKAGYRLANNCKQP